MMKSGKVSFESVYDELLTLVQAEVIKKQMLKDKARKAWDQEQVYCCCVKYVTHGIAGGVG